MPPNECSLILRIMSTIKSATDNKGNGYDERDYQWLTTRWLKVSSRAQRGDERGGLSRCIVFFFDSVHEFSEFITGWIVSTNGGPRMIRGCISSTIPSWSRDWSKKSTRGLRAWKTKGEYGWWEREPPILNSPASFAFVGSFFFSFSFFFFTFFFIRTINRSLGESELRDY